MCSTMNAGLDHSGIPFRRTKKWAQCVKESPSCIKRFHHDYSNYAWKFLSDLSFHAGVPLPSQGLEPKNTRWRFTRNRVEWNDHPMAHNSGVVRASMLMHWAGGD